MAIKIFLRRGTTVGRESIIFEKGELVIDMDTNSLYIGDGITYGGLLIRNTHELSKKLLVGNLRKHFNKLENRDVFKIEDWEDLL